MFNQNRAPFAYIVGHELFGLIMLSFAILVTGFCKILHVFAKLGFFGEKMSDDAYAEDAEFRQVTMAYIYETIRKDIDRWNRAP